MEEQTLSCEFLPELQFLKRYEILNPKTEQRYITQFRKRSEILILLTNFFRK